LASTRASRWLSVSRPAWSEVARTRPTPRRQLRPGLRRRNASHASPSHRTGGGRQTAHSAPREMAELTPTSTLAPCGAGRAPAMPFTAEHDALRETIRDFVAKELRPHAEEWEAAEYFPDSVFDRMGELGLLGLRYPEKYGGQGGDYFSAIVLAEEMARCRSGGVGMAITVQAEMATPPIFKWGTEEQKQK